MVRILVISDSHGDNDNVRKACKKAGKVNYMIHLGDIGYDYNMLQSISGVPTYMVAGNNDYGMGLRDYIVVHAGGHKIYCTHGHRAGVHYGVDTLRYKALEQDCDIALYGHTHMPFLENEDTDVIIMNPGSVTYPRQSDRKKTFAILEIDDYDEVTITFDHI